MGPNGFHCAGLGVAPKRPGKAASTFTPLLPLPGRERAGVRVSEYLHNLLQDCLDVVNHLIVPKA
jgi:hypothetical protein